MGRYTIEEFLARTTPCEPAAGPFELEQERKLKISLNGQVWLKADATITHTGPIEFRRERLLERGVRRLFKRVLAGEVGRFREAVGSGELWVTDRDKRILVLRLRDDAVLVAGRDVLAFEPEIDWDVEPLRKWLGVFSGWGSGVRLQGRGLVAITTRYDPIAQRAGPQRPAASPSPAVRWTSGLEPEVP